MWTPAFVIARVSGHGAEYAELIQTFFLIDREVAKEGVQGHHPLKESGRGF